jgi:hypothetical protein
MAQRLSFPRYAMSRMAKTEIVDIPQPYKSIVIIEVVGETPYEGHRPESLPRGQ